MARLRGPSGMRVVSTFPLAHAEIYGEDFLLDCARFDVPLTLVHYEPFDTVLDLGEVRIDATSDPEVRNFLFDCHVNRPPTDTYRHQARRFCFKAFAMTRPDIRDTDWLVWLDADVRMHNDPDWQALFNHRVDVCYLGRSEWDHSETGFLVFNMRRRGGDALDAIRAMYTSRSIFYEQQWHDAWIFDLVRERLGLTCHNLSPDAKGLDAWEASPLADWSRHLKGNRKFMESECAPST